MYVGKILGKTIRLWNTDYKSLKKKWHPSNIEVYSKECFVDGDCGLCGKFKKLYSCPECPLGTFSENNEVGCILLLNQLFRRTRLTVCEAGTYFKTKKSVVKRYMQKIQDILDTFKKESGGDESSG